jgi:NAD(P)-dependent dehydrogenase (short-subunit alcohol dehydrogenase family)
MPTLLVTGSNRGIGLEFVRQYSAAGWEVIATCRAPDRAEALQRLAGEPRRAIDIQRLDVTDPSMVTSLAGVLGARAIDLLIANAGITVAQDAPVTPETFDLVMHTNALGPLLVAEGLADRVAASDKRLMVFITSRMGSIATIESGGALLYRASKAALNAGMRTLSFALKPRKITAIGMHPGWVRTDMGGSGADLAVDKSVADMMRIIGRVTSADSGHLFNHSGEELPW